MKMQDLSKVTGRIAIPRLIGLPVRTAIIAKVETLSPFTPS